MPNYDFECPKCGERFERFLMISERNRDDVECPECGHQGARRAITAPNLGSSGGGGFSSGPSFPT